jgi:hypothetical protein
MDNLETTPNCTIGVSYDSNTPSPSFSYKLISSTGWSVEPDGSIHTPLLTKIIQFQVSYPSDASFTGFQIVSDQTNFQPGNWYVDSHLGATLNPEQPSKVLTLYLPQTQNGLLFYKLAVDNHWDEPKVYDDGSI